MAFYYIVKKGGLPGNEGATDLGAICDAWAKSAQKDQTEVIAVSRDGPVICRFAPSESEQIASDFRNPKLCWLWKSNSPKSAFGSAREEDRLLLGAR
jgi:hypothetical protein